MIMNRNNLYDWSTHEILKTPTMTMRICVPIREVIRTANPANVEHILKTKFENYPKGHHFRSLFSDFAGVGMLNSDGREWKLQRKFASPFFSMQMLKGLALSSVQRELTQRFTPVLDNFCEGKTMVDLQELLFRSTCDSFCQLAFSTDPGCLNMELTSVPFATAFDEAVSISCRRIVTALPPWRWKKLFNFGSEKKLRRSLRTVDAFVFDIIETRRQELAAGVCKHDSDLLSTCIKLADELVQSPPIKHRLEEDPRCKSIPVSDLFLRDFMVTAILAGRDTSACGLSWFFWLLSWNRIVEDKILHEIQSILASRRDRSDSDGNVMRVGFSFEELKGMHYLHAALTESMRLYPPVPQELKEAVADDVLPDGTAIAKGQAVSFHVYAMGRNESIWGSDCLAFRPERFLSRTGSFVAPSPFDYPVFLAGPRMCLGMDMAMMQMKLIAATLLCRYVFVVEEGHCAKGALSMTMKIEEGLPVYVRRREG